MFLFRASKVSMSFAHSIARQWPGPPNPQPERIETVKIEMLTEAARLEKELMNLKNDADRIARWHDGRVYIDGVAMEIHELFRPAVETMFSTGIEVAMKSVKDQLRAIGVDPEEEK